MIKNKHLVVAFFLFTTLVATAKPPKDTAPYITGGIPSRKTITVVHPYLQNLGPDRVDIYWVSRQSQSQQLRLNRVRAQKSVVTAAPNLALNAVEREALGQQPASYLHRVSLTGLAANRIYRYEVNLPDGPFSAHFTTWPERDSSVRFIAYADSETEPESTGTASKWKTLENRKRRYLLDQTEGYSANLEVIKSRNPRAILIAGDLVESGGEQRDWNEFWKHNAGGQDSIAGRIPILPAPGNHEYYGGPSPMGKYSIPAVRRAQSKFKTYFHPQGPQESPTYYAKKLGPVTLIALDSSDGLPHQSSRDTNFYMNAAPNDSPGTQPGSRQYEWLEKQLAQAQRDSAFTFVYFHHCPYSSGPHGYPAGKGKGYDKQSGTPLRIWTPLFLKYGVDSVICGHDEMFERSVVKGTEVLPNGELRLHQVQFYDVGVGGDGLRLKKPDIENPHRAWIAGDDSPEVWKNGELLSGGRHYGHLEINVEKRRSGWVAILDPVHVFPIKKRGKWTFERRLYQDRIVLKSRQAR